MDNSTPKNTDYFVKPLSDKGNYYKRNYFIKFSFLEKKQILKAEKKRDKRTRSQEPLGTLKNFKMRFMDEVNGNIILIMFNIVKR